MSLFESLSNFKRPSSETELTASFKELALHFIYGGYINVNNRYRVYIRTVEFYFHDEEDRPDAIKDPIVYHRNRPEEGISLPYFPLMTLNAHNSGFDITFENADEKYRASALIREYSIYDIEEHCFLSWQKKDRIVFRDDRSTFLYDYLNGFALDGTSTIVWVDDAHTPCKDLLPGKRRGVCKYEVTGDSQHPYKKKEKEKDERLWSFKLDEEIWSPTD